MSKVSEAMAVVLKAMQEDPEYAWGWHCNIAMAFVDEGGDPGLANHAAARFLRSLADVEPAHPLPHKCGPAGMVEMREQLQHLIDDITHCPNPTDPERRFIKPKMGLAFSNMVNACVRLLERMRSGNQGG